MVLTTSAVWLVATMSDMVNSTFVFLIGSKLRGKKKDKIYVKWRNI